MNLIFGNQKSNRKNLMVFLTKKKSNHIFFFTKFYFYLDNKSIQIDWENIQKQRLATKRNWMTGTAHLIKCLGHTERYKNSLWIIFMYRLHKT
jgi:hypothetical protein